MIEKHKNCSESEIECQAEYEESDDDLSLAITGDYADELTSDMADNIIVKAVQVMAKNHNISTKLKISLTKTKFQAMKLVNYG